MSQKLPNKFINSLFKLIIVGVILLSGCERQSYLLEQRLLQFGTVIDITLVHDDRAKAEQTLTEIERQLINYRRSWHAWEDSDLTRFNRDLQNFQTVRIPVSLIELINLSKQYYVKSNHLFNPALGKLIAAYGFHGQSEPDEKMIKLIQQDLPTMLDLEAQDQLATNRNVHLKLDFGGIAKGYAVGQISDYLQQQGFEHYLINAGGDLITSGNKLGNPWRIGVQNPFQPGAIGSVDLMAKLALFTSGNYARFYQSGGEIVHHIIDPRTGEPSRRISSATVISPDPVLADVAATTLMIGGLDNHRSLARSLGIEDYMIVDEDQKIIISRSMAQKFKLTAKLAVTIVD